MYIYKNLQNKSLLFICKYIFSNYYNQSHYVPRYMHCSKSVITKMKAARFKEHIQLNIGYVGVPKTYIGAKEASS